MSFRTRKGPEGDDPETVIRVRTALDRYLAVAGPGTSVSVAHVLDLLNPRGLWRFDPEFRKAARDVALPEGDPLTGCRPVTAPPIS